MGLASAARVPFLPRPAAPASLIVDLARVVGAQHVSSADAERLAYARDCWPRDILRLRAGEIPVAPSCVVWPETAEEVARVLRLAEQAHIPVVPYGAGSSVVGGARPSAGGIVLDLKRMRAIRRLDEVNLRAEVESGVIGERLERALNARGYTLGHFPSSIICSTLGGWLAARSAGQMSTLYGKIEDMVLAMETVTPGRVRRFTSGPRSSEGPDFNALVVGSEGTFGVITAAELRLRPLPRARELRGYRLPSVAAGLEAIRALLRSGVRPAVVRLYDALDTLMGRGHGKGEEHDEVRSWDALAARTQEMFADLTKKLPRFGGVDLVEKLRGSVVRNTVRAVLGSPLVLNRALEVLPEDCLLILGFEGQRAMVAAELELGTQICLAHGATDLGPGPGQHWLENRYNVSFKASKIYASGLFADTLEVASTWDRLLPLYKAVRRAIGKDALVLAHFSHAYPEGCSIYFTFAGVAGDPRSPGEALERYDRIWRNALIAVHEAGGTISHHHGVGESKAQAMAREHGPGGMRLLTALQDAFDPAGIMNPGKLGLDQVRRPPPRKRPVFEGDTSLPKALAAAVGERNITADGGRTRVRPPDESALAALLRVAHLRPLHLSTDQTGFRPPRGVVRVDLSRFEGVSRLSEHSLFVEVEAGVVVERLERLLNAHRLTLGHVHPRALRRSVGAGLARGFLVRRGLACGDFRDLCFAVRGLLANGQPVDTRPVPRSATGPELDRAFIGAQGRLGIITKATLRVAELPPQREVHAFSFSALSRATEVARRILHHGVRPAAARVVPAGQGGTLALKLVAPTQSALEAQQVILRSAVAEAEGVRVDGEVQPTGGRFDAVVEVATGWARAPEVALRMREAAKGEAWLDFLAPEGLTVVARVVDTETRYAAAEAGMSAGGRVISGARPSFVGDPESYGVETGVFWRDIPVADPDARIAGPFDDVLEKVAALVDPTGMFQGRG